MTDARRSAPGGPGAAARWSDANKSGIGTAISDASRVWFSTARGVLTEVFYPAPDRALVRALGFIVTDGAAFFSDEVTQASHETCEPDGAAPIAATVSTCLEGHYRIEKETLCEPNGAVVLQRVRFVPTMTREGASPYRLFLVLEPHLGDEGNEGVAEIGEHKGTPMLFAYRPGGTAMALACSAPWLAASVGFAGTSDGKRDLKAHRHLVHRYDFAGEGNVGLTAEIDQGDGDGTFTLALGFGTTTGEAAHAAHGALLRGYDAARVDLVRAWEDWTRGLRGCKVNEAPPPLWTRSTTVLKTLEAKRANGGRVAALSTPWGASKGPGIDGTYHLVWTRDLVECLGALLAAGAQGEVKSALHYLRTTQEADGHWPQNMHLSGESVWNNDELDEVALPIVLLHLVQRGGLLKEEELGVCWPMVRGAAGFLARRGPSTKRDRWEDVAGVTPFTVAAEVVALLIAADMAERRGAAVTAGYLRDLADEWNEAIDTLLYRRGGELAEHVGVDGYYVRVRKPGEPLSSPLDVERLPKTELSPDALALVRFGLRAGDDPRMVSTVRVIDAVLKTDFDSGPCWRRYPGDEYGEHEDGAPFDGHGVGRPWPLFTGERAHYELACGRPERAEALLRTMESFANAGGMLSEQIWDQPDILERGLVRGGPSGSAAPLGWAHAEYVKLCRSIMDGAVFDMPVHARDRYVRDRTCARVQTWRVGAPPVSIRPGKTLRIVFRAAGTLAWSTDRWRTRSTSRTVDAGIGIFYADVPVSADADLRVQIGGDEVVFTKEAT